MEKLKNLCGQIPEELHNKVRTEQESLGLTLGKYLEQVLTAHFAAPAPAVRGGDRTLAFQVPEVLFQRVKQYLEAHKPLSQKAFVVGLLENALSSYCWCFSVLCSPVLLNTILRHWNSVSTAG